MHSHFLRLLAHLRWIAIAGQVVTIAFVARGMHVALPVAPLAAGVAALALFNAFATWRARRLGEVTPPELFAHLCADLVALSWLVGWSGGLENPFSSLFLIPIALAVFALPPRWVWAVAACATLGFLLAVAMGRPLPHIHGAFGDAFGLHKLGMLVNFAVSAGVMLVFFARFASAWRSRERELASLRERFARNEGIVALATHAASVAHELNTPLATMTLLAEELKEQAATAPMRRDVDTLQMLVGQCRDRVRALASPAQSTGEEGNLDLESIVDRWQLVRPTIDLSRGGLLDGDTRVEPGVGHLLLALLNNAADAGEQVGDRRVELTLRRDDAVLTGTVRDFGVGFERAEPKLPGELFRTSKPDGLGIGLALSHATVERLGGTLAMQDAAEGAGVVVTFRLPVKP